MCIRCVGGLVVGQIDRLLRKSVDGQVGGWVGGNIWVDWLDK